MWTDIETVKDLLNFTVVAKTAAQLIRDSSGQPISMGISGNWGTGKSSLVKMIGKRLKRLILLIINIYFLNLMFGFIKGMTMHVWHCYNPFLISY